MTRIDYPRTTASQREVLFKTWEATKDVAKACSKARVSERTFYNWKPRFETGGYEALEQFASHAPQKPKRTPEKIEQEVIELRRQNGNWGKQRIADELAKKNNWSPVISPNTVKRMLQEAQLWSQPESKSATGKFEPVSRTAEMPEQSLNVDLCFVPPEHKDERKLPAVSGSSGRLVVERVKSELVEADYPGTIFANEPLDYAQAMAAFVATSKAKDETTRSQNKVNETKNLCGQAQKRLLRQQETALALERGQIRGQRRQEDAAWQTLRRQRQSQQTARKQQLASEPRPTWGSKKAQVKQWRQLRDQRHQEDDIWRHKRLDLRAGLADLGLDCRFGGGR